jgi:hypothetical protein
MSATVAGTTSATPFRPNPTYTTLRDVTHGQLCGRDERGNKHASETRSASLACHHRLA